MAEPYSLGIRDPDIYNPPSGRVDASVFLTVFNLQLWLTCLGTWAGITLVHFCVSFSRNRYDGRSLRPGALSKQLVESSAFLVRFIAQLDDGDNKRYFLDLCARKFHNKTPGIVASCVHCAICILTFHKTCRKSVSYKALLLTSTALAIVLFASFGAHITSFMTLIPSQRAKAKEPGAAGWARLHTVDTPGNFTGHIHQVGSGAKKVCHA